eukprot:GFUD01125234.1.p1 GENE.GFUD01125234.1~~GFUD01125234.1.p1  ORF type:complete len:237 (-),score=54.46 GFUD01125234.1:202-912(-)
MSRSATMETLRDLSSVLWTIRSNQEAARVLRTTNSLLRTFLFFDICYLISGIALITMALTNQLDSRDKMIMFGGLFGVFASVSALCNSLASHGIRTWRRNFLLPWMLFFLIVLVLLIMHMGHSLYFQRAQWRHIFLFFANIVVFSCWRHMQKQFILMALPRPHTVVVDVEAVVREYLSPVTVHSPLKDLPPKYEDVEDFPPQYDEQTMISTANQTTTDRASTDSSTVQNEQVQTRQ